MLILGLLMYYGSALLPLGYFMAKGAPGGHYRPLLKALLWHVSASIGVIAYMYWCRYAGYREWYWAQALNIPVNVVFAVVYLLILGL